MSDSMRWFSLVMVIVFLAIVYLLGPVIMPFLIAFLLAYFLDPLVMRFTKWKIPRKLSACLVFFIGVALITGIIFSLLPALESQIKTFAGFVPSLIAWLKDSVLPWVNQHFHLTFTLDTQVIQAAILKHLGSHANLAKTIFSTIFNSGYVLIDIIMNLIMVPVITLYLLIDWVKVTKEGKNLLPFSPEKRDTAAALMKDCGDVLAAFFRGQLLVMIGSGIVYTIGLSIVGLKLALLIGVLAGILTIVPYLGFISGISLALIATAIQFSSPIHLLFVLIVFAVGVLCENFVFSPLFVGDRIGLHPVAVIFSVLAGGKLFGFVGVLLALPAAAVIMVLFRYVHSKYFEGKEPEQEMV